MSGFWRLKSNRIVDAKPGPVTQLEITEEDKHPYVPAMRVTADMNNAQKETAKYFNSMRKMLLERGLMQEKNGGA